MSYARILVPVDGSQTATKALVAALDLARDKGGAVRVIHVIDETTLISGYEFAGELIRLARERGEKILAEALNVVRSAGVKGDSRLVDLPGKRLGDSVADEATAWQADLVVVGTHGRRGMRRLILGSGAESVIRLSRIPVLVIRGEDDEK